MINNLKEKVISANIEVHSALASQYNSSEPHFRPENISKVTSRLRKVLGNRRDCKQLDLGCGTGFMIDIGKTFASEIVGVDVTKAMTDLVDLTGPTLVTIVNADTGAYKPREESFDFVTAYSFLHHLYDIIPTLKTAYSALKPGGFLYADLEPNYYFWEAILALNGDDHGSPILKRELNQVAFKDVDIENKFGIDGSTFNHAEYSKNILGGFKKDQILDVLKEIGFSQVDIFYSWFLGQGSVLNDSNSSFAFNQNVCSIFESHLLKVLPVSRSLFKYVGFYAFK
jgi:ubiquinone/menaquinone biosynthesis C-methylase UbiE